MNSLFNYQARSDKALKEYGISMGRVYGSTYGGQG
jgi:hypothetical protein